MKKNELRVIWALFCASSSFDQQTNNVSVYNILEQVTFTRNKGAPKQEAPEPAPLSYEYIILLQRSGSTENKMSYPLTLRLYGPKSNVLNEAPIPAVFEPEKKRLRIRVQNNAFIVDGPGEYRLEASLDGEELPIVSTPLEVHINNS